MLLFFNRMFTGAIEEKSVMENAEYKPRLIDAALRVYLQAFGAVVVEGPKWCGKTWTAEHVAVSEIKLGDPSGNFQNRQLAQVNPALILEGAAPRLIDEWQEVPAVWDAVRAKVDESRQKGRFILTGSSTPQRKGVMHSGAGRIARVVMRTMSLYEQGISTGDVSLQDICEQKAEDVLTGEVDIMKIAEAIIRGGWPETLDMPFELAALLPGQYIEAIIADDASRIDGKQRDGNKMRRLLHSLARNESTTASNKTLKRDIQEIDNEDLDVNTLAEYLDVFDRLFLIDNQPPFSATLRSSARVKQQVKRHLCDPSVACSLLGIHKPAMLVDDLNTMGFLFEALVEHDLRIYAESFRAKLYHYQDYNGKEMDAVIELENGSWCGVEIKLGAHQIDEAAKNLLNIAQKFEDGTKTRPPAALCVVCGLSNAAYRRPDGVYVVPLTALKP